MEKKKQQQQQLNHSLQDKKSLTGTGCDPISIFPEI